MLAEHRLERCLAAADRVVALDEGAIAFDGRPRGFGDWALDADPDARAARGAAVRARRAASRRRCRSRRRGARCGRAGSRRPRPPSPRAGAAAAPAPRRGEAALAVRDLWVELDPGDGAARGPARARARGRAGRAGRADGPQRRRQEHPAARRRGPGRAGAGHGRGARAAARCCRRAPPTCFVRERVGEELPGRGRARGAGRGRARVGGRRRPARPLRRRARAARAGDRDGRAAAEGALPGLDLPRRADPRHGRGAQARAARLARRARRRAARRSWSRPTTSSSPPRFAERVVLLGDGELIADGPADEILSGGWYFATEVARILGGGGAITPERGRELLLRRRRARGGVADELAARDLRRCSRSSSSAASSGTSARGRRRGWSRWSRRWRRSRSPAGWCWRRSRTSSRPPTSPCSPATRSAPAPGFAVGALAAPISNIWLGQGPWTAWQMAGWGLVGLAGAWLAVVSGRRLGRLGLARRLRRWPASPTARCSTSR